LAAITNPSRDPGRAHKDPRRSTRRRHPEGLARPTARPAEYAKLRRAFERQLT
jgi:hypothetical protein